MRRVCLCAVVLVLVAGVPGAAWERDFAWGRRGKMALRPNTTAEVFAWRTELFGDVNVKGMALGLENEASFAGKTRLGLLTLTHGLSEANNLVLTYNSFDHTGRIHKAVTFDRRNYQPGANIQIQNNWFDLAWSHNFRFWENAAGPARRERRGGFLDGLLGIKVCKADIDVAGLEPLTNARARGTWSGSFPIPYLGVGGGSQLSPNLWVDGHARFIATTVGGGSLRSSDLDLNAALRLNPEGKDAQWFGVLGYRFFRVDGASGGDEANLGYRGPMFGLLGRF